MRKRLLTFLLAVTMLAALPALGEEGLLFSISFDEGQGAAVQDGAGRLPDADVQYQYLTPVYTGAMDPQWRETGVENGSLLFDGSSTYIAYDDETVSLSGKALTVSLWASPRAFEWDDPYAAGRGDAHLTALIGQYNKSEKQGLILGYQRFGRLCVEVGTGEEWYTLWADDERLSRCQWNHVAAVFDGDSGTLTLYLNGKQAAWTEIPKGASVAPAANKSLLIGRNAYGEQIGAGNYQMFCGLMDELKVYTEALDETRIAALADRTPGEIPYAEIGPENILTGDIHKTQYHGGPYQHWMNEPHAPMYYNGMYHLFFQSNSIGTYWRNISWGHLVSTDTVHWRPVKDAIVPTENSVVPDGVWSGCASEDKNGVPVLFFTAGNDSFRDAGLISNQNIGIAWPKDLSDPELTEWVIGPELAVVQQPGQGRAGEFRDPYVWREDGSWYMLVCSGSAQTTGGSALLYVTDTLEVAPDGTARMDWRYMGPVYEMENQSVIYGTSWELPILVKLSNQTGTVSRWAFFISPAPAGIADNKVYYFIGDFDKETGKFTPDPEMNGLPRMLDYGSNVFTGPSVMKDPVTGRTCMFSIMQDQRTGPEEGAAGWAHCVGLTRNLTLNEDGTDVCVCADPRLHELLGETLVSLEGAALEEANEALAQVKGDLLYLRAVLTPADEQNFGLVCKAGGRREKTTFTYYTARQTVDGFSQNRGKAAAVTVVEGALPLKNGQLEMEVWIDRSLIEAFFNGDKAVSVRAYPGAEAQGIQLFADGSIRVDSLEVRAVRSIYE